MMSAINGHGIKENELMELLTNSQLLELLNDIESDTSERKRSFKGDAADAARQAICAFANDLPGHNKPGGLYGNVTPENFGRPGIVGYRNPNLSATMKVFDFVQTFGRGITIARNEMKRNGNPEPEFITDESIVRCIMRAKPNGERAL